MVNDKLKLKDNLLALAKLRMSIAKQKQEIERLTKENDFLIQTEANFKRILQQRDDVLDKWEIKSNPLLRCYEAYRNNRGVTLSNKQVYDLIHMRMFNEMVTSMIWSDEIGYDDTLRYGTETIPELRERYQKKLKEEPTNGKRQSKGQR